jgi:hypothetical protein
VMELYVIISSLVSAIASSHEGLHFCVSASALHEQAPAELMPILNFLEPVG